MKRDAREGIPSRISLMRFARSSSLAPMSLGALVKSWEVAVSSASVS
jgi:hypothetical protein